MLKLILGRQKSGKTQICIEKARAVVENGKSVMVQKNIPEGIRYKQLLKLKERGVEIIENNA